MKRVISLVAGIALFGQTYAQIKVTSNGNFGVGIANPQYKFQTNINGDNKAVFSSWTAMYIDATGPSGATCIYPHQSWYLHIGKSDKRIGCLWATDVRSDQITTGILYYGSMYKTSDIRLKENVRPVQDPIGKLQQLNAIRYNLKDSAIISTDAKVVQRLQKDQIGFSAQEMYGVFPELTDIDSAGRYAIDYVGLIPVLTEAIKTQQAEIEALEEQIEMLNAKVKKSDSQYDKFPSEQKAENSILYDARPNPFSQYTELPFYITETAGSATMYISNMQGTIIQTHPISTTGNGSVLLSADGLTPGLYFYTLLVDGQEIGTKRMILTK